MDGGSASIPLEIRPPLPSLSLMEQIRVVLSYAEDRHAKVSFIKTIIKRKQEDAIPPDTPRDLIIEAKIRLGQETRERIPDDNRKSHILQVKNEKGMMLSDEELAADEETRNMETSNSGPTPLQIKNVEHRADTWSSLFQKHSQFHIGPGICNTIHNLPRFLITILSLISKTPLRLCKIGAMP